MRVHHNPSKNTVSKARQDQYLKKWPVEKQLEAHLDAANGKPEKLEQLKKDVEAIKASHPFL